MRMAEEPYSIFRMIGMLISVRVRPVLLNNVTFMYKVGDRSRVMRYWLVFRPACLTASSPSSTLHLGRSPVSVARSILQMLSPVSTGFQRPSTSSSNWRSLIFLCTELFTALHLSTYRDSFSTSPICRRRVRRHSSSSIYNCQCIILALRVLCSRLNRENSPLRL